jgi:uncharacterized protein (TIGR02118 family)
MIKLIHTFRKRRDLTDAQFEDHWENVHAPIGVQMPRLRRLVHLRAMAGPRTDTSQPVDGIAEWWFDDMDALREASASAAWELACLDQANFVEPMSSTLMVSEERAVFHVLDAIDSTDWPEDEERPALRA